MFNLRKLSLRNYDWYLIGAVLLLTIIGGIAIYSIDLSRGESLLLFKKQMISASIGFFLLITASLAQYNLWRNLAKWWYLFSIVILMLVLFFGQTIRGTRSWFSLMGFSFQPVELAKAGLILILAYSISHFGRRFDRPLFFYGTGFISFLSVALVIIQPDLGSAILLCMIWFGLMLVVGARRLHILTTILLVIFVSVFGWFFFLKDYQKERLAVFVDPGRDPLGSGYNLTQSMIAVGAGKLGGRGLGFGSQSQLHFLPEAQTDFIFAVIGEELGFAGVSSMLILFAVIFWRLIVIIKNSKDDFVAITAAGILILFVVQFFTNIGANIGLLPITGVTLPFVSYGGSSLIVSLLLIGILQSMIAVKKH
ncbi:MAG: rod shape-determining protein RodA [bacterium]